jgi:hypothetical protein
MKRRIVILCFAAASVVPLGGSASAADEPAPEICAWGASSITAVLEDGEVIVSGPETSGCVPQ